MFKNRTAITIILAAFFPAVISISGILAHAQGRLEAQYGITMAGVPIGNIVWHVEIGNNFYATSANGKASRVLSVLISGEGSVTTSGKIENAQMAPTYFSSSFFDEDGKTELQVIFAAGISKELIIQEPLKKHKLIPLDDVDRRGVTDPLSAMLISANARDGVMESANCNHMLPIFDGRRRYNLVLTYKRMDNVKNEHGYSGPILVCGAILQPIGGYRADSMIVKYVASKSDIEFWFAPITGTSVLAPIRMIVPTLIGMLKIQADRFEAVASSALDSTLSFPKIPSGSDSHRKTESSHH